MADRKIWALQAEMTQEELDADQREDQEARKSVGHGRPIPPGSARELVTDGALQNCSSQSLPEPPLPIDEFMRDLWASGWSQERSDLPPLLLKHRDKPLGELCFEARSWINLALGEAARVYAEEDQIKRDDKFMERKSANLFGGHRRSKQVSLIDQVEAFVEDLDRFLSILAPPISRWDGNPNFFEASLHVDREANELIQKLKSWPRDAHRLLNLIAEHQRRFPGKTANNAAPWMMAFVNTLAKPWFEWTGVDRDPRSAKGQGFIKFVGAAYRSAGGDEAPEFIHQARAAWRSFEAIRRLWPNQVKMDG